MGNFWIWKSVYFISISFTWILVQGSHATNVTTTPANSVSARPLPDVFAEYRSEYFDLGRSVDLQCTNKTLSNIIFTTWWLNVTKGECRIASMDNAPNYDTCKGGVQLRNMTNGESFLHIPHFTSSDEGIYKCETVFQGGSFSANINISVRASLWNLSTSVNWNLREAVCSVKVNRLGVYISWRTPWNFTATQTTTAQSDGSYTLESRAHLPDGALGDNLSCVVTHASWKQEKILIVKVQKLHREQRIKAWQWIIISVGLLSFIIGLLMGFYIIREHLSKIRVCCKSSISSAAPNTTVKPQDVEELEPYASYVQRVNSIYNSSAELCST